MFETEELNPVRPEDRTITIFLNRDCPRSCYQCGIADNSRRSMPGEDWIRALGNLRDVFGATFFLFLGVEPLLLRQGMLDIVNWLRENNLEAAWYTTSPEPLFTDWRLRLVAAGVDNWSSGVDSMPGFAMDPETDKKVIESIRGLKWMANRGVKTHVTTTVHKKNLHLIPDIMEYCYQEIPNVEFAVNFIHWRQEEGFDFFSPPKDMADMLWTGRIEEQMEIKEIMQKVWNLAKAHPERRFHSSEGHVLNAHRFYDKLNLHCQRAVGPSVDADGTMRMCGYNTGKTSGGYNVLDLDLHKDNFMADWEQDVDACSGCYWGCYKLKPEQYVPHKHPLNVRPV